MFETSTDGVVELNVRAKKYYKPQSTVYNKMSYYIHIKTKITQESFDNAVLAFKDTPGSLKFLMDNYEAA